MVLPISERIVLQLIETGRATSQIQIGRLLGIPPNTIHGVIRRLEKSGLVSRDQVDKHGRGRPLQHYRIKKEGSVLVILWLGSVWQAGIFLDDQIQGTIQTGSFSPLKNLEEAFEVLKQMRDQTLSVAGLVLTELMGIVLAINASRTASNRILSSSVIPWIREASEEQFSRALGCKVQLDLKTGREVSELRTRVADGVKHLVVLNVGDGVSANGVSVHLPWGIEQKNKGELGHVVLDPKGSICGCGHRGCLETLISGPALLQRVETDIQAGISTLLSNVVGKSPAELFFELEQLDSTGRDPYASTLVDEFLDRVAWCVSLIVNMIEPDVIILSGYGLEGREKWRERILQKARALILYGESKNIRLEFPKVSQEDRLRDLAKAFKD